MAMEFANSCINPFIYGATYREFQNGIRRMVRRITGNLNQIQSQQSNRGGQVVSNPTNQHIPDTGITRVT